MQKLIDWLHKNRTVNWIVLCLYFLLVVLPHEIVGRFIMNDIFESTPRSIINSTVLTITLVGFSLFLFILIRNLIKRKHRKIKLFYLLITFTFIVLVYNNLFVLATESAHFPQYALMAILLFPLTLNYNSTLFGATVLGFIDEAYQYFVLNPKATGYLDFNDVITDLLGAVLGLLLIWICGVEGRINSTPWYRRKVFVGSVGILLLAGLLILLGYVSIYPNEDGTMAYITLMRKVPNSFWSYDKVGDLNYHVIHPIEGLIIIGILLGIYSHLGKNKNLHQ